MTRDCTPLSFSAARDTLTRSLPRCTAVSVPLHESHRAFIAEDIYAPAPFPRYTNSAMDGFALRAVDTQNATKTQPVQLDVIATIPAGIPVEAPLLPGKCAAIMTGAIIPENADAVVKIEDVRRTGDSIILNMPLEIGRNIRYAGDEIQKGSVLITKGTELTPPRIGLLASIGKEFVRIYAKPRIALLITGDEICLPPEKLQPGQIYDSVGPALSAAMSHDGFCCLHTAYTGDTCDEIENAIEAAAENAECLLITGGASMSAYDYVYAACKNRHIEELFWKVAVKPGKPLWAGFRDTLRVFNMPGNPVSVMVSYCLFVRRYLLQWAGCAIAQAELATLNALLTDEILKNDPRHEFIRGIFHRKNNTLYVSPLHERRSDMLSGMAKADCLISVPENVSYMKKDETVCTYLLPWRNC